MTVKVSVIVPVYNPGDRILRVIRSLDRQTMGTHDFEAVFVDDGSTDGTADRLHRLAAQRPNMRVARMPNSGWPSWPRNVGIGLARGDYLLFMDHDDELGDDALRRAYDFAVLHGSDVVIGKEVAVGRSALESEMWRRNVPRASIVQHQLLSLLTVHRLFRRKLLLTHDIRFPERVGLLEDQPFALKSYLTADTVSVLADYPVYRWIVQEGTSSQRQPNLETAHANIRECVDLVESYTSSGPERDAMLGRWLGSLADSVGPRLLRRPAESWSKWLNDVRRLVEERFPARLDALATPIQRIRLAALRAGDLDALVALAQFEQGPSVRARTLGFDWHGGVLGVRAMGTLVDRSGQPMVFERDGDRLIRRLPASVARYAPDGLLDITDAAAEAAGELKVRHRSSQVEWYIPGASSARLEEQHGGPAVVVECTASIDPSTAALGAPLESGVWDVVFWMRALGYGGSPRVRSGPIRAAPALVDGVVVIAYRTKDAQLALDVGGTLRTVVGSAHPEAADADIRSGPDGTRLTLALPRVHVRGAASLAGSLSLQSTIPDSAVELPARLLASESGAQIESYLAVVPGRYALRATFGGRTTQEPFLTVNANVDGTTTVLAAVSPPQPAPERPAATAQPSASAPPPDGSAADRRRVWPTVRDGIGRRLRRRASG